MVFDPLDGSSNIDAGISVGSIFGIYAPNEECSIENLDNPEKMLENCILNVCQPGSSLLVAGYCLYSSATILVLTIGHGTWGFTYDSMVGEFILSHRDIKVCVPPGWVTWQHAYASLCMALSVRIIACSCFKDVR